MNVIKHDTKKNVNIHEGEKCGIKRFKGTIPILFEIRYHKITIPPRIMITYLGINY